MYPSDPAPSPAAWSGVGSSDYFAERGHSRADVRRLISSQGLRRIRQGWFAVPNADADTVAAVRVGGRLTCVSLFRQLHIWCVDDRRLHVAVERNAGHLASPHNRSVPLVVGPASGVVVHRHIPGVEVEAGDTVAGAHGRDSVLAALLHATRCQSAENALVAIDSALNKRLVSLDDLRGAASSLPAKTQRLVGLADARADSGLETKARLRLKSLGIRFRLQHLIPGVGRVDLLVGDRLVIELDGRRWHTTESSFEEDRRRDLGLHERGYLVMRLTYWQVMNEWSRVETVIRGIVHRREHRWAPRHQRAGFGFLGQSAR